MKSLESDGQNFKDTLPNLDNANHIKKTNNII